MRTIWASLFAAWLAIAPAAAEVPPADRAAIEETIRGQLAAFMRDDAPAAYGFASRTIQALFPTPDFFMQMVRRAYAPLYRATDARFRGAEATDGGIRQPMVFRGPDGRFWLALYTMQRQPDGSFRIDGCTLVALPDAGA
jgi:hypothetical protein